MVQLILFAKLYYNKLLTLHTFIILNLVMWQNLHNFALAKVQQIFGLTKFWRTFLT